MTNPLKHWTLDPSTITTTGVGLRRPECVLAEHTGDLWVADLGGVLHIRPDGSQALIRPRQGGGPFAPEDGLPNIDGNQGFSMPNGLCFDANGDFVIANFGTNVVEHLTRDGQWRLMHDRIDGRPLGKTNFPAFDAKGRLWITVTASAQAWSRRTPVSIEPDGHILLIDDKGPRVVMENVVGANEIRFDDDTGWVYVAETAADHITRFRVTDEGVVYDREVYGPQRLGGAPDGFAFDAYGNLWTTLIGRDRLVAITPEGDVLTLWEDGDPVARAAAVPTASLGQQPGDGLAPRMASITFGGPDLCTVYIGSLQGRTLPTFRSPVPGKPLAHWGRRWGDRPR
jgi:sugar lactone lactonase YvrE